MNVVKDHYQEGTPEQLAVLHAGMTSMGVEADLIVTNDFLTEVRRRTGLHEYSDDRGAGIAAAKTIGETILINAPVVLPRSSIEDLRRLSAHEAGHVLIYQRGESFRDRQELAETEWQWNLMSTGGSCLEEARIERELVQRGFPPADAVSHEHFDNQLFELNAAALESVTTLGGDVDAMILTGMTALTRFSKMLAYAAAAVIEGQFAIEPELFSKQADENWNEYVESTWDRRISLYASVPTCTEVISPSALNAALLESMHVEGEALRSMGFEFRDVGHTWGYYSILAPAGWDARLQRLREEIEAEDAIC